MSGLSSIQQKIVNAVLNGLAEACNDSVAFNGFEYPDIKPEYLLTVNVAQQIRRECDDLAIRLEEKTSEVVEKCIPDASKDLMEYFTNLKNFGEKISREGKFDIVLYPNSYREKVMAVVELKGFQASTNGIQEDIRRIAEFLVEDTTLQFGLVAYIRDDRKCFTKARMAGRVEQVRIRYQKLLNKHFNNNLQITTTADARTVYETLFKNDEEINSFDDEDLGDEVKERVHYVGVIVLVERKSTKAII